MKPIEELAQQVGVYIVISTDVNEELVNRKLEALCKQYLKDRLSELEPVGYISPESTWRLSGGGNDSKGTVPIHKINKRPKSNTPLYDISSLLEKE